MPSATPSAPPPSATSATSALPPPSTFDILPPLHSILSRLLLPPPQLPAGVVPATSPSADSTTNSDYLAPKHLGTATSEVKNKIQKARVALQGLPDMERTVQEQELEIEELEREAERLRGVIRGLANAAKTACEQEEK